MIRSFEYDRWLLSAFLLILALGLLMVASSSMVISDRLYGYPFHFLWRQLIYLLIGLSLGFLVTRIEVERWRVGGTYLFILSILLLFCILLPGLGHRANGSIRWLHIGIFSLQVSELTKLSVVLYLAGYLVRRENEVQTQVEGFIKPMFLMSIIAVLLLLEPDFGATTVIMATALGMMFLAGVRLWQFIILLGSVVGGLSYLAISAPYRLERLMTFLHPWANPFDSGYQLTQSLIAFGRGGIFGVGLGNSIQKLFYLPEAHTDFLFAVLAEELGLLGECIVISLFVLLVGRALKIGQQAYQLGKYFESYIAYGLGLWLGLQAMINIGVNAGILPTKGLTLPLMSYGGNSILMNCVVIGLLFRIAYECKLTSAKSQRSYQRGVSVPKIYSEKK